MRRSRDAPFAELIDELRARYSFTERKSIDWDDVTKRYASVVDATKSPEQFADAIEPMLAELADIHVWVETPDGSVRYPYRSRARTNANLSFVRSQLSELQDVAGVGFSGRTHKGFAYVAVTALPADGDFDRLIDGVRERFRAPGFVVDLRSNRGGSEPQAARVAGLFASQNRPYARNQVRLFGHRSAMRETPPRRLRPADPPHYPRPVVCLIGPGCVSSGEGMALMMKSLDQVTMVGLPTRGASGNPQPVTLSNAVRVWFSRWSSLEMDGTPIEGVGVRPDIRIEHTEGPGDVTFERGLRVLEEAVAATR